MDTDTTDPMKHHVASVHASAGVSMSMTFEIASRSYHSVAHLIVAGQFVRMAKETDDSYGAGMSGEALDAYRSFVTAAIIFSAAFLEAAVNELFTDAVEQHEQYIGRLATATKHAAAEAWPLIEKRTVFEKANLLLGLNGSA